MNKDEIYQIKSFLLEDIWDFDEVVLVSLPYKYYVLPTNRGFNTLDEAEEFIKNNNIVIYDDADFDNIQFSINPEGDNPIIEDAFFFNNKEIEILETTKIEVVKTYSLTHTH